jgi:putative transposase
LNLLESRGRPLLYRRGRMRIDLLAAIAVALSPNPARAVRDFPTNPVINALISPVRENRHSAPSQQIRVSPEFPAKPTLFSTLVFRVPIDRSKIPTGLIAVPEPHPQNICGQCLDDALPIPQSESRSTQLSIEPDLPEIPVATWELAKGWFVILEALLHSTGQKRSDVRIAADRIGCGLTWTYELLRRLRANARLTSLLPKKRGRRKGSLKLGSCCEEIVCTAINEVYLTRQQPTVSALMIEIRQRCLARALPPPSRRAVQRRIDQHSAAEVLRLRRGRKAARDRFGPVTGSFSAERPLAVVQIDHTLVDVMLVDLVTREPIKRPWLTLAIDIHTRCVLGFSLSLDPPSATSVALCIAHAALPKDGWLAARRVDGTWPMFGLPKCLHLDNGQDFHSHALSRGCDQYGIELQYRPVKTPRYGGHIERLIGTFMGKVHLLPGTTFSNIAERGDLDPEATAALTLEELEQWLAIAVVGVYHETLHRGIGMTPSSAGARR